MPRPKTISEIYKEHKKSFLKHLNSAKSLDEEKIHKLRVDAKYLRSLLTFFEFLSKNKISKKKILKLISPVFKSAGKIRTTTLNIKLTKVYRSKAILGFKIHLQLKEKKQEKILLKTIKKFDRKKFEKLHKKTLYVLKKTSKSNCVKRIEEYVKGFLETMHTDIVDVDNNKNFHDVRKKLKEVKNLTVLLENISPKRKLIIRPQKVEAIEEKIGKWHDTVILVQELEKFIMDSQNTNARPTERDKNNNDNEKLSILVINLKARNETNKKIIIGQLKNKLF
jgi:CHAD domain-containing protein